MGANYNSAILRLHQQQLDHFLLLLLLLTPCVTPLTFHFPAFKQSYSRLLFTEADAVISNQFIHMTKENLRAESRSVARATYREPFLLRENATGKLPDFTTSFAFIMNGKNRTSYGEGLAFFLAPNGSLLNRALGKGSSLGLPVNSSLENIIEPSNDYPFVAVEFDTCRNSWPTVEDPDGDHVGIDVSCLKSNITRAGNGGVVEAKLIHVWIRYKLRSKNLGVAFTTSNKDTKEQRASYLSYMVDLNKYLADRAVVGFSASITGANSALHNIISWNFTSTSIVDHESLALAGQEETKDETPVPAPGPTSKFKARKRKKPLAVVIGSSIGGFILVCFLGLGLYNSCKKKATRTTDGNPNDLIHEFEGTSLKRFPYEELVLATRNFFEGEKLGEGGSGVEIYKGYMTYLNSYVAVKKISRGPKHGIDEYAAQLQVISRCMHRNLVQLIGWCHEKGELLLVYEFMPNGSLETHLFTTESLLFWELRYKIVQGLASGLLYLHEYLPQPLLHTNIKPSNVMVDSDFNAKLGDFGLGLRKEPQMITTSYMAPEYIGVGRLSDKSDVFSFGIVALEISCGRKLIDPTFGGSQVNLVEWVWELYVEGKVIEAADPKLRGDFNDKQMECLLIVGLWCAHQDYNSRPSIREAFCVLNFEAPLPILPSKMPMGTSPPATLISIGSEGGQMESGYGNAINSSEITESSAVESRYGNATNSSEIIESSAVESGYGNVTNSSDDAERMAYWIEEELERRKEK